MLLKKGEVCHINKIFFTVSKLQRPSKLAKYQIFVKTLKAKGIKENMNQGPKTLSTMRELLYMKEL